MDSDLQTLIDRFKDFPAVEWKPSFLDIARFPHRETVWRNILAFFFNPNECHGLKDLFLRAFFNALGKREHSTGDFDSIQVRTECQTEKGKFLDLLITCNEFALGIEMKVNAKLYNDLEDYGNLVEAQKSTGPTYKVVISNAPCQTWAGFTNLRYADLIPTIKQELGNYVLDADPKYTPLLLDFLTHITNYTGGYAMSIDPKQLEFMQNNHHTVKRLIDTHYSVRRDLEERMAQIHDALVSQTALEPYIGIKDRLFTYQGDRLSKIQFKVEGGSFRFQLAITDDYRISTHCWVEQRTLTSGTLKSLTNLRFDLTKPAEEIVSTIEQKILLIVKSPGKTQSPQPSSEKEINIS